MPGRIGNVLLIASVLIAGGWVWINYAFEQRSMGVIWGMSAVIVLIGLGARYVLAGGKR